jgi:hypothetical protein
MIDLAADVAVDLVIIALSAALAALGPVGLGPVGGRLGRRRRSSLA